MNRFCQECKKNTLKLSLFRLSERIVCSNCLAQYELTSPQKWFVSFFGAFMASAAIYAGILLQSWAAFIFVGLILPASVVHAIERFGTLKLTGLKGALRAKGL
ncbi:MAG: hypothetical protein EX270_12775 [Pseudomonadales bacterium]|nr:MAG: hypothetical protein EX270_12775 [Pseudomonadales bacterium]